MSRILVTGGAGFIGSHLSNKLIDLGHEVRVIDSLMPQVHGENPSNSFLFANLHPNVDFVNADIQSLRDTPKVLCDIDAVVHLAAETGTGQSMYEITKYSQTNILGTSVLLESIIQSGQNVKKIIVASTRAVYGEGKYFCYLHGEIYPKERNSEQMKKGNWEHKCEICHSDLQLVPTDEHSELHPQSIYGITKLAQEQMVLNFAKSFDLSATAIRLQNVYGPGQSLSNPYTGILSVFATRILNDSEIEIFEDGKESRDFIFITDVIRALKLIIEDEEKKIDIYNIGSETSTTVLNVAESLIRLINPVAKFKITGQFRFGDIRHNIADIRKFKDAYGFSPKTSVEEGLREFASWVKTQSVSVDKFDESMKTLNNFGLLN
jgi:dTDP-L-rhamnose 4-epimerase